MGDPQAARGRTLLRGLKPRADTATRKHRLQRIRACQLHADAAGGRQHGGLHLRRHAARTYARASAGHEHAHKVVRTLDALDELRARVVRRSGVETVHVRQQREGVGLDHLRDERGEAIVISETQLAGGHRVVFVENRDDSEAEEARQRGAHVRVVVAAHDVVRGQQHLGGIQVMRLEGGRPPRHQKPLAHRGGSLHARQVLRFRGEAERIKARCDRARRDDDDLAVRPSPARDETRNRVDTVQIQAAVLARERRRADLDDDARSRGHSTHD